LDERTTSRRTGVTTRTFDLS